MTRRACIAGLSLPFTSPLALDPSSWWHQSWSDEKWRALVLATLRPLLASEQHGDEVDDIADWAWGFPEEPLDAIDCLGSISERCLEIGVGGAISLSSSDGEKLGSSGIGTIGLSGDAFSSWLYLTRDIPPDLLCATIWQAMDAPGPPPVNITAELRSTQSLFATAMGDYHVHWGAALSYRTLLPAVSLSPDVGGAHIPEDRPHSGATRWQSLSNGYEWHPIAATLVHGFLVSLISSCVADEKTSPLHSPSVVRSLCQDLAKIGIGPVMWTLRGRPLRRLRKFPD